MDLELLALWIFDVRYGFDLMLALWVLIFDVGLIVDMVLDLMLRCFKLILF